MTWKEWWTKTKLEWKDAKAEHYIFLLGLIFVCICPFFALMVPMAGVTAFAAGLFLMFLAANTPSR